MPNGAFHVKVNMDGILIGRKVDLYSYTSYEALSSALEDMFPSPNGKSLNPRFAESPAQSFALRLHKS
jgi:hypothetical protein